MSRSVALLLSSISIVLRISASGAQQNGPIHIGRRYSIMMISALCCFFHFNAVARSADYDVAYAIEVDTQRITGKLEGCVYHQVCAKDVKQAGFRIGIVAHQPRDKDVGVYLTAEEGCCFFSDAARSIRIDSNVSIFTSLIFEGRARRRNESMLNRSAGRLYIAFSFRD